jgi:hypothetical protein
MSQAMKGEEVGSGQVAGCSHSQTGRKVKADILKAKGHSISLLKLCDHEIQPIKQETNLEDATWRRCILVARGTRS